MTPENNNCNNCNLMSCWYLQIILILSNNQGTYILTSHRNRLRFKSLEQVAQEHIARLETQIQSQNFLSKAPSFFEIFITYWTFDFIFVYMFIFLNRLSIHSLMEDNVSFGEDGIFTQNVNQNSNIYNMLTSFDSMLHRQDV